MKKIVMNEKNKLFLYSLILLLIGFFTYVKNYTYPDRQFWDENYHVASAYKYIKHTFFLEPHPPLGKLLIALGEEIKHPGGQKNTSYFLTTDYIKKFPKNFKFDGVRLFPTLAAWFNVVLFFLILYYLTNRIFLSFFGSFFYLFDNALIVHSRAAMLESIQLFFIFLSILIFLIMYRKNKLTLQYYIGLGFFIGLAVMVKANSLIVILLYLPLLYKEFFNKIDKKLILKLFASLFTIFLVSVAIFKIHFSLANHILKNRTYHMTKQEVKLFKENKLNIFQEMAIYYRYIKIYEKGVPKYNPCKKGENGSLAMTWPIMDKTITYRWHKVNEKTQYLTLIGNPIVWLCGLIGVILSFSMIIGKFVYGLKVRKEEFEYILFFSFMYFSYMIAIMQITRVMYLYHYFIPLTFSIFLFILQINYIFKDEIEKKDKYFFVAWILLIALVIFCWWWFSPFTYYKYLNLIEFNQRNWFDFWHLKAVY